VKPNRDVKHAILGRVLHSVRRTSVTDDVKEPSDYILSYFLNKEVIIMNDEYPYNIEFGNGRTKEEMDKMQLAQIKAKLEAKIAEADEYGKLIEKRMKGLI
jgi:hypothetical protein